MFPARRAPGSTSPFGIRRLSMRRTRRSGDCRSAGRPPRTAGTSRGSASAPTTSGSPIPNTSASSDRGRTATDGPQGVRGWNGLRPSGPHRRLTGGEPPENGVWESQAVRAVAVAKAVAWEREREVPRALIEYPSVGTVREVQLTTRKKAAYRRRAGCSRDRRPTVARRRRSVLRLRLPGSVRDRAAVVSVAAGVSRRGRTRSDASESADYGEKEVPHSEQVNRNRPSSVISVACVRSSPHSRHSISDSIWSQS